MAQPVLRKDPTFPSRKAIRKRRKRKKTIGFFLVVVCLIGIFCYKQWQGLITPIDPAAQNVLVTIPQGTDLSKTAQILADNKVIRSAGVFAFYVRLQGSSSQIKAGEYLLSGAMTPQQILEKLYKGQTAIATIAIPEGFTTKQIAQRLEEAKLINPDVFWKEVSEGDFSHEFVGSKELKEARLEGYLFPATYKIIKGTSEHQILAMMLDRFAKELTSEVNDQLLKQNLTIQQWVTMGSLVEREAKKAEDRPIIAGVFYNRLKINMRLESCATIQYVIGYNKAVLSLEDTKLDSPYNTYQKAGLPPTPIANPGKKALEAALNPTSSKYLYFLAKPDGYSYFSESLKEHTAAMARFNVK